MQLYNPHFNSDKNLIFFFAITLLWTWVFSFTPVLLGVTNTMLGKLLFYSACTAPSIIGLLFVFTIYPNSARKDFLYRSFSFKEIGIKWPLLTVLFFALIVIFSLLIGKYFHLEINDVDWMHIAIYKPYKIPLMLFISFILSMLSQEFGWRGYSLDKLLVRFGFTGASIILGTICGIWYLGWYLTPGQIPYNLLQYSLFDALLFIPSTILLSFVITFVYINTHRSILAGGFVHMMCNFFTIQLCSYYSIEVYVITQYVKIIFCLILIIYIISSTKFKQKINSEIEQIKSDEFEFELDWGL
ncbi:CPBP family intramembrane metalloprotease [Clostridioides sp. ZZV15-6598]|nr:CPBP family intramembrane metalloprotease [Clostridioides sp. ZZV15-6598]